MHEKTGIIIQARTGSSRLPKKIVLPFYQDNCVLDILLLKLSSVFNSNKIVVATTTNQSDDLVEGITLRHGCMVFRGDETDVLKRFIDASDFYGYNKIIRICADNPFLSISSVAQLCNEFDSSVADYICYATSSGIPTIKTHYGFWCEAVRVEALKKINIMTTEAIYHEHVTNFIYSHRDIFDCKLLKIPCEIENKQNIRMTLDTIDDFNMLREIYAGIIDLGRDPSEINDVVAYLECHTNYYKAMKEQIKKNKK